MEDLPPSFPSAVLSVVLSYARLFFSSASGRPRDPAGDAHARPIVRVSDILSHDIRSSGRGAEAEKEAKGPWAGRRGGGTIVSESNGA